MLSQRQEFRTETGFAKPDAENISFILPDWVQKITLLNLYHHQFSVCAWDFAFNENVVILCLLHLRWNMSFDHTVYWCTFLYPVSSQCYEIDSKMNNVDQVFVLWTNSEEILSTSGFFVSFYWSGMSQQFILIPDSVLTGKKSFPWHRTWWGHGRQALTDSSTLLNVSFLSDSEMFCLKVFSDLETLHW